MDKCIRCGEPVEGPDGVINLDANGVCDGCNEQAERAAALSEDMRRDVAEYDGDPGRQGQLDR